MQFLVRAHKCTSILKIHLRKQEVVDTGFLREDLSQVQVSKVIKRIFPLLVITRVFKAHPKPWLTLLSSAVPAARHISSATTEVLEENTKHFHSSPSSSPITFNHLLTCATNLTICSAVLLPRLALVSYIKLPGQTNFYPCSKITFEQGS